MAAHQQTLRSNAAAVEKTKLELLCKTCKYFFLLPPFLKAGKLHLQTQHVSFTVGNKKLDDKLFITDNKSPDTNADKDYLNTYFPKLDPKK